jgi:hypothetical protein
MRWFLALVLAAAAVCAQTPVQRVSGEVTAVDAAGSKFTVKTDAGTAVEVSYQASTRCLRVPAGVTDSRQWPQIPGGEVAVGDRVVARGAGSGGALQATIILVMAKADVTAQQQAEREEWQKRGVAGLVTAVDAAAKTVTVTLRLRDGSKPLLIETTEKTRFKRYAPDSVRYADAKASSLAEVKVGDQLRALGTRSEDGTKYEAEQIVFGTFDTFAATVVSVDAAARTVVVKALQTRQNVTVHVAAGTLVRRLPEGMAQMLAMRMRGGSAAGGGPAEAGAGPRVGAASGGRQRQGGWSGGPGGPGGEGGHLDLRQMLERLPATDLADLKPGDAVIVSDSKGNDASNVTAITIVAGVEPFLASAPRGRGGQVNLGSWSLDAGMPEE